MKTDPLIDLIGDLNKVINRRDHKIRTLTEQRDRMAEALREVVKSWDDSTWLNENDFERFRTLINETK